MTFNSIMPNRCATKHRRAAFTLIEVLVATLFMVIVIPVALGGMRVASLAGESAQRKLVAARIATNKINDLRVENLLLNGGQRGVVEENGVSYSWSQRTEFWNGDPLSRLYMATLTVEYNVAGRHCNVQLSVLVPPSLQ
jgi:type II secretory pathway pseudopilin PulG